MGKVIDLDEYRAERSVQAFGCFHEVTIAKTTANGTKLFCRDCGRQLLDREYLGDLVPSA